MYMCTCLRLYWLSAQVQARRPTRSGRLGVDKQGEYTYKNVRVCTQCTFLPQHIGTHGSCIRRRQSGTIDPHVHGIIECISHISHNTLMNSFVVHAIMNGVANVCVCVCVCV